MTKLNVNDAGTLFEAHRSEALSLVDDLRAKILAAGRGVDVEMKHATGMGECINLLTRAVDRVTLPFNTKGK
jgi:hypothetical protein